LTSAGQALRDQAIRYQDRHESKLTAALGEQSRRDLLRILDRLTKAL
jgi:DNA-binding MarR family transcriptional regulator